jgi:hypothetical protein
MMFLGTPGGECFPSRICKGMHMQIIIQIRSVYGNNLAYPMCENSKTFARMLNSKTINRRTLYDIEHLGFTVMVSYPGAPLVNWNGDV